MNNICYATEDSDFSIMKSVLKLFLNTFIIIIVIVAAIYGTKLIAKGSQKFINSKYINVIDGLKLDANTKISIIKVDKTIYILAITNSTVTVVDKLLEEDFKITNNMAFEEELNKHKYNLSSKNKHVDKLEKKINKFLNNSNKFADEEDKNDEKMD